MKWAKFGRTSYWLIGIIYCSSIMSYANPALDENGKAHHPATIKLDHSESVDVCESHCPICMESFEAGSEIIKFPCNCVQAYHRDCFEQMDRCGFCRARKVEFDARIRKPSLPRSFQLRTVSNGSESVYSASSHLRTAFPAKVPYAPPEVREGVIRSWPGYEDFESQFNQVPEGLLSIGSNRVRVRSFAASIYPVTRKVWQAILPGRVPAVLESSWYTCLDCPMTYVRWELNDGRPAEIQKFLSELNVKTEAMGCTYDLPTDEQLVYMMRGDQTGSLQLKYFLGEGEYIVDDDSLEAFAWYGKNSEGQIHPVGNRLTNQFGLELSGNVSIISKTPSHIAGLGRGQLARGGGWFGSKNEFNLNGYKMAFSGMNHSQMGFTLIRNCSYR